MAFLSNGYTNVGTGAGNVRMYINGTNGNVGIGTTTPLAKLDIGGTISGTTQAILARGNLDANFQLQVLNGASPLIAKIGILYGVGGADNASVNYYRGGTSTDGYMAFSTQGIDRMTVYNNGNVGIGVTAPGSTLHVNGSLQYSAITTTGAATLTLAASDPFSTVVKNTATGLTVTLPTPSAVLIGRIYYLLNSNGTNSITITASGNLGATTVLINSGRTCMCISATAWHCW
jgi:hypothetical protein